jgi:hypothetical protein
MRISTLKRLLIKQNEGIEIGNETLEQRATETLSWYSQAKCWKNYDMHLATRSETLLTCRGFVLNRVVYNVT